MSASKHQLHADLDFMLAKDLEHRNMFKKLEEICVGFGIIADRFCKEKHYFDRESLIMAGSLEEGITISRSFKPREEEEKNIPLILDGEVDQMRIYLRMKKEDVTPLLEISQRNIGYLKMRWDNILHERLKKHFDVESVSYFATTGSNKVRYMDPTKLRSLAAGYAYDEDLINRLLSLVLREVVKLKYWKSTTRASSCFEISGFIKNIYLSISIDHVPAMHLDFWPDIADEWRNRSRLWPPKQKIDEIVNKGCLIVARSSHGGDERSEQTFSFRGAEIELAHLRTTNQLKVYGMCKIIHYHHIKPFVWVGEKGKKHDFSSYPIKTTMLWFCEQHPPDDPVWDDANLLETIDMLLKIL